jgi:hypothetical protein
VRTSIHILSIAVAAFLLGGCTRTDTASRTGEFTKLMIESRPKGWGYAHKTITADGAVTGGHLSGGPEAPRVWESKAEVAPEDMSDLRSLIASITPEDSTGGVPGPDQKVDGSAAVVIIFGDSSSISVVTKDGQQFHSKTIQTIWDLVYKHEVGAW